MIANFAYKKNSFYQIIVVDEDGWLIIIVVRDGGWLLWIVVKGEYEYLFYCYIESVL